MRQSKLGREEDNEGETTRQEGKEMRQGKEEAGKEKRSDLRSPDLSLLFLPCPWPSSRCGGTRNDCSEPVSLERSSSWKLTVEPGFLMLDLSSSIC